MLPLHWGVIEIAQRTGSAILPIVMDYQVDRNYHIEVGELIKINPKQDKKEVIDQLQALMETMRLDIWKKSGSRNREKLSEQEWQAFRQSILKEYPRFQLEFEQSTILQKGEYNG